MYVQQNGVDNVYNLGLILFRDLVSFFVDLIVRSLSAKYRPDRYRCDKSVKFGTELP